MLIVGIRAEVHVSCVGEILKGGKKFGGTDGLEPLEFELETREGVQIREREREYY
jgi:hypothetical protein